MNNLDYFALLHLELTWYGIAGGVISGGMLGLFLLRESWLGGYGSFARRMLRLGHIAFFGMAFFNCIFSLSCLFAPFAMSQAIPNISLGFIIATVGMPLVCFLCARWKNCYYLFPIPVMAALFSSVYCLIVLEGLK